MGSLETLKPYHQMKDEEGIVINDNTKYYGGIRIFSGKQTETPSMTTNFENIHENKYSSNSISIDDAVGKETNRNTISTGFKNLNSANMPFFTFFSNFQLSQSFSVPDVFKPSYS